MQVIRIDNLTGDASPVPASGDMVVERDMYIRGGVVWVAE